jgi:ABC-type Mn2+/Zn2+ transport system permease subunit
MRLRRRSLLIITALACTGLAGFELLGSGTVHAVAATPAAAARTPTAGHLQRADV